jgi:short-subunit dehydrogenase
MNPIALITGATAGLGAEFAAQLAAQHYDLVIVARDRERLASTSESLSHQFGVQVECISADLATKEGLAAVQERLADADRPVDLLVNNAGFGLVTTFHDSPLDDEDRHLELLVAVPMRLSHTALRQMVPRRTGTIINVASVAAYTPRGTYGAAKAWIISFSRWANIRYRRDGITVTAVAPGFVHTEFHQRMKARTDNIPNALWLTPDRVVADALRAATKGKPVTVPTLRYKVVVALSRVLPSRLVAAGALRGR